MALVCKHKNTASDDQARRKSPRLQKAPKANDGRAVHLSSNDAGIVVVPYAQTQIAEALQDILVHTSITGKITQLLNNENKPFAVDASRAILETVREFCQQHAENAITPQWTESFCSQDTATLLAMQRCALLLKLVPMAVLCTEVLVQRCQADSTWITPAVSVLSLIAMQEYATNAGLDAIVVLCTETIVQVCRAGLNPANLNLDTDPAVCFYSSYDGTIIFPLDYANVATVVADIIADMGDTDCTHNAGHPIRLEV